jgi:thiamine transport system ATP-binding protein
MFQDQALFPHRDVGGNVGFGLQMRGIPPAAVARSVAELLELVGLPGAERRPIAELSGGEQQRVALARALAPSPRVLLLDEPLGALDRTLRERLVTDLRRLFAELSLTVVAVTHDQDEAFALADRIAVMDRGRILQVGAPAEVWGSPSTPRVATLLGLGNVVEVDVVGARAVTPWGELPVQVARDGRTWVILRPTGVVLDPAGTGAATVLTSAFRGERTTLELGVAGAAPLQADVPTAAAPRPGADVRFRIDPGSVIALGP